MEKAQRQNAICSAVGESQQEPDELYRQHRSWLLDFLRRRFGSSTAEDLAQEAFARVVGSRSQMRHPRAFLARVAIRVAIEEARRNPSAPLPFVAATQAPSSDEALMLEQTILALPPALREVFVLSRFGGLSNVEIAQRCNLSVKRVEARITKARAICAALIRD